MISSFFLFMLMTVYDGDDDVDDDSDDECWLFSSSQPAYYTKCSYFILMSWVVSCHVARNQEKTEFAEYNTILCFTYLIHNVTSSALPLWNSKLLIFVFVHLLQKTRRLLSSSYDDLLPWSFPYDHWLLFFHVFIVRGSKIS